MNIPNKIDEDAVLSFSDPHLDVLMEQLEQEGVDVPTLLEKVAKFDPDELMRKHRAVSYKRGLIDAQAQAEIVRVTEWAARKTVGLARSQDQLGGILRAAALTAKEKSGGKIKNIDTPCGRIQLFAPGTKLVVEDEAEAMSALQEMGLDACVKATWSVRKDALKKLMKTTPELDTKRLAEAGVQLVAGTEDTHTISHTWDAPEVSDE